MPESIVIPERFNGPPGSANGGYACGLVAGLVGADVVEVSLRAPPPLGRPLAVERSADGARLLDGGTLVAEGAPSELLLDVPAPVSVEQARAASEAGRSSWTERHPFPTCVVCGPERGEGDGMRIFPGPVPGREGVFAATWTPAPGADGDLVAPERVWAALDCPTSAPVANWGEGPPVVLARLGARLGCSVEAGRPHVVLSWPLAVEGRKRHAASALFDADGRLLCAARALWIELRAQ